MKKFQFLFFVDANFNHNRYYLLSNNQTKQDDDITVIKNLFVNVLKDFSDNPEKLFDVFARISNLKNITNGNNTNYNKTIEKITTQSVSILKAFSKI